MKIKHIDIVLKIDERIFGFFMALYLFILRLNDFLASRESAPCSILSKIFKNNLSTISRIVLIDFFKPNFRKFIDLTDADLSIF